MKRNYNSIKLKPQRRENRYLNAREVAEGGKQTVLNLTADFLAY